ncbi:hypothetical protein [Dyadobacter sp. 676]|uniref:DUF1573 domain-containing protein n=1 Tax=Dyadobacter sp. 676 TaxID=3088362 RepID=A0AAU8FJV0_9BACT
MKKHYILLFMLAAALYGCIESAPVADDVKSSAPGFGSSQQRPEGTKLDFPAGIGMSGKPHRSPHYADEAIARKQIYGSGPLHFCLRLSNATGESVTVTLPAGTIFVSEDEQLPNALLIKEIRIKVPEASTMSCYLMAYSVNQNRTSASSPVFEPQAIVTSHYALPELMSFLAAKKGRRRRLRKRISAFRNIGYGSGGRARNRPHG